jgi:hypothetical protein
VTFRPRAGSVAAPPAVLRRTVTGERGEKIEVALGHLHLSAPA